MFQQNTHRDCYTDRNKKYIIMKPEIIGTNAGTVWNALNTAEALGIKQIKKITKLKDKEVYAALGWLAREGKININTDPADEKEYIVSLVQDR